MHQEEGLHLLFGHHQQWALLQKWRSNPTLSVRKPACLPYLLTGFFSSIIAVQRSWNLFAIHSYPPTYKVLITLAIMASVFLFFFLVSLGKLFFKNRKWSDFGEFQGPEMRGKKNKNRQNFYIGFPVCSHECRKLFKKNLYFKSGL
jgi:hypothetical protein